MSAGLPPVALRDWLEERMNGDAPPIYRLTAGATSDAASRLREGFGAEVQYVVASGALRFRAPYARDLERSAEAVGTLISACRELDDREYTSYDETDGVVVAAVRSLFEGWLPAIGPGGGAIMLADGRGMTGEVVVRRRLDARGSRWRDRDDVLSELAAAVPLTGDVSVTVELGYFEAGAGTVQEILRPALLFVVDRPQPEDAGAGWRRALVLAATTDDEHSAAAGIESWWEGE
jgi:hypothetical protein